MRVVPAICHKCRHHAWQGWLTCQKLPDAEKDNCIERFIHRRIRGEVRCEFATTKNWYDTCMIEDSFNYTKETPEQCPHKFEMAVARGMKW